MGAGQNSGSESSRTAHKAVTQARSGRRGGRWWWIGGTAIVVALLVVVIVTALRTNGQRSSPDTSASGLNNPPATVAAGGNTPPPWPAPADAAAAVQAAGLPMLNSEGAVEHIHAHLDVLVDGQAVPVPATIGIDAKHGTISPLHTHDASGVIHIESPVKRQFSLGEFFSEWDVSLSADNVGALRVGDGKSLRVFVNGKPQSGDPAAITFGPHDEIAVVYGKPQPGESIPAKYDFPPGD
ncbi:hypothetical protein [Mycobacterium sp. MMS18-G62]